MALVSVAGCTRYEPVVEGGGQRYVVRPGDTIGTIAARHRLDWRAVARANRLRNPDLIFVGQVLRLPTDAGGAGAPVQVASLGTTISGGRAVPPAPPPVARLQTTHGVGILAPPIGPTTPRPLPPRAAVLPAPDGAQAVPASRQARPTPPSPMPAALAKSDARVRGGSAPPPLSGDGFLWPVAGEVVSGFGDKPNGQRNDGVNIAAPAGAPIVAAENGLVVYAGEEIAGFGKMVLLRHADDFTTAYAHAETVSVAVGQKVGRGQVIGRVGATGVVERPQLHFELRSGRTPLDPGRHLVGRANVIAAGPAPTS